MKDISPEQNGLEIFENAVEACSDSLMGAALNAAGRSSSHGLMSSAEGSPAKTLAMQDYKLELMEKNQDSGEICSASFASYDLLTSLWRTSQLCLSGELSEFSGTWPRQGMTRNGEAFGLPISGLCKDVNGFSLLPTMRASMSLVGAPIWKRTPNKGNLEEIIAELYPQLIGQMLNVQAGEWLMGFPIGWTSLER